MSKVYMPFFGGDFVGNTLHLTRGEIGAYMLLLWHHWEHGSLPADQNELARISRCERNHWPQVWQRLSPLFDVTGTVIPGRIVQSRVLAELTRMAEISRKNRANALRSHSQRKATAQRSHSHSASSSYKDEAKTRAREGSNGPAARARVGDAKVGERMGKWVYTGSTWIEWEGSIYAREAAAKADEEFGMPKR